MDRELPNEPRPLEPGVVVAGRFRVEDVLGRGGFGITYLCEDLELDDHAALKELAPSGARRNVDGSLEFAGLPMAFVERLRHEFYHEASLLRHLALPGLPQVRACGVWLNTAFHASEYLPGARSLQDVLRRDGPLPADRVREVMSSLLACLEHLHKRKILHRDVKPSNVLQKPDGSILLIDFGAARQWLADSSHTHSVLYTPGYTPIEQMSERARRGAATDLYAVGATGFALLAGRAPPPATDRAAGLELPDLAEIRPDADPALVRAIESALEFRLEARPQSTAEMLQLLEAEVPPSPGRSKVETLDEQRRLLRSIRIGKRQCPACDAAMEQPTPLPAGRCPLCQNATLKRTSYSTRVCPICRTGVLHVIDNSGPLRYCPICRIGELRADERDLRLRVRSWNCVGCGANFSALRSGEIAGPDVSAATWQEWRRRSRRSSKVLRCDVCSGQFDELADGRRDQIHPLPERDGFSSLYPDEWARVAAGKRPGAGNLDCAGCGADFFECDGRVTLLDAPVGISDWFVDEYLGRAIEVDDLRWLAVGKTSGRPGLVCQACSTEFDANAEGLALVRTDHPRLRPRAGEELSLAEWRRVALGLPLEADAEDLDALVREALVEAYEMGEVQFDADDPTLIWKGPALECGGEKLRSGTLTVRQDRLEFRSKLRTRRWRIESLCDIEVDGDEISLEFRDREELRLRVEPVVKTYRVGRSKEVVEFEAENLARRLRALA